MLAAVKQAAETLERTRPVFYPEVAPGKVSLFKRECAASVLELLRSLHPEIEAASLHWFTDADEEDKAMFRRYEDGELSEPSWTGIVDIIRPIGNFKFRQILRGLFEVRERRLWIHKDLTGWDLIETTAHEWFHSARPNEPEAAAGSYGKAAAALLSPEGGLFFSWDRRHFCRPGDSTVEPHDEWRGTEPILRIREKESLHFRFHNTFEGYRALGLT